MDRRVKYTKSLIKDTFFNLLEEKDLTNITVTELCNIADINRATFYRYYEDIYDLLKEIQSEFIEEFKKSEAILNISKYQVYNFTKEILEIFLNNQKLVKILFDTNNSIYFLTEVFEVVYDILLDKWLKIYPNKTEEEIIYALVYVFNGALGIINYWVKNNFNKDIEEISRQIENLTINGIKQLKK